jgi:hypothetical protein
MCDRWRQLFDSARHENGLGNFERADALVADAIREADQLRQDSPSYSSAQGSFALWRYSQNRFAEAERFQRRHIEAERRIGIGPRELASFTLWLAEMQHKQGHYHAARDTMILALEGTLHEAQRYARDAGVGPAVRWGLPSTQIRHTDPGHTLTRSSVSRKSDGLV